MFLHADAGNFGGQFFDQVIIGLLDMSNYGFGNCAIVEGIVGVIRLTRTAHVGANAEQQAGIDIIRRAVEEPLRMIAQNAGHEASVVVDKVANGKGAFGFNAATETYGDLVKDGVIDPTKVVRTALQNAASVSGLLLTTHAMIADKPKDDEGSGGGHAGHQH